MKLLLAITCLALPIQLFASDNSRIFFPSEVADGKLILTVSGVRVFHGNGWADGKPGKTVLPLTWIDKTDERRMFIRYWSFELPEGDFLIGAERRNDEIIFALTKKGDTKPTIKSEAFKIETYEVNHYSVVAVA